MPVHFADRASFPFLPLLAQCNLPIDDSFTVRATGQNAVFLTGYTEVVEDDEQDQADDDDDDEVRRETTAVPASSLSRASGKMSSVLHGVVAVSGMVSRGFSETEDAKRFSTPACSRLFLAFSRGHRTRRRAAATMTTMTSRRRCCPVSLSARSLPLQCNHTCTAQYPQLLHHPVAAIFQ